jgi:hypothetical protein
MRQQGNQMLAGITRESGLRIGEVFKGIKINETRFIGVMAEEPTVCYWAILSKLMTDVGTEKAQIEIGAATVIRGKFIAYHFYSPYVSDDTIATMMAKHKSNVAALVAVNKI